MVIELSLTFDLYLVLDSGSGVSISYRDPSRQPVHHSVDMGLEVQYESRTGYTLRTSLKLRYRCSQLGHSYTVVSGLLAVTVALVLLDLLLA
ncbi:hypothetical protein SAMN02745225_00940 [Ferrithrix thermotolerans DSM 19514]|uniref:Uncharacterized protein n=1 Tax=Ferrithrix thermotolerans DSM 19514 TaxID=1121881 RepID=A0A1M4UF84_9ACTN|nr:hypothetical protein SAMN02745225_00940 [Ferrithrix thermotolerans DSM 19514]